MGQAAQLGQQGSEYGQYGSQPISPASPFGMNLNTDENKRVNDYNAATNIPSPQLPANIPNQNATWFPGMYPTNQPQFGTNAYSPQTFNVQGHPGDGHNPLGTGATIPNQAMSNQGQMVKQMATGGTSSLFSTIMPKTASGSQPSTIEPVVVNKFSPSQEAITHPSTVQTIQNVGKGPNKSFNAIGGVKGPMIQKILGQNNTVTPEPMTTQPPPPPQPHEPVYQPTYAQYAPVNRIETDSYGNPLYANGGLTSIGK
jgi:hypothetical protein